jgi:hypothetical protein
MANDHRRLALKRPFPPPARELPADRGDDSVRRRADREFRSIAPCIPSTKSRNVALAHHAHASGHRSRIDIMFGRLKDWRHAVMSRRLPR